MPDLPPFGWPSIAVRSRSCFSLPARQAEGGSHGTVGPSPPLAGQRGCIGSIQRHRHAVLRARTVHSRPRQTVRGGDAMVTRLTTKVLSAAATITTLAIVVGAGHKF